MAREDPFELSDATLHEAFALREPAEVAAAAEPLVHRLRSGHVCDTEHRGHATPENRSPLELILEATEGFIPLWHKDVTLRWRFQERSLLPFRYPEATKTVVRALLRDALLAWGDAAPVRFSEHQEAWDFEIAVRVGDQCRPGVGCTLASAFFPDQGQHELVIYPMMFDQVRAEQVETMAHELGHVFGLRHFFALTHEGAWPAELFGEHRDISIMNYGEKSLLTNTDRADLKRLYELAWSGELTNVNGTPVRLLKPFSSLRP